MYLILKPVQKVLVFCLTFLSLQTLGCTIFVITDSKKTLFFNNEDWSNPVTRIWFIPAGDDRFAAAYVGFDDGWSQGGVNSQGLAFDWVAGVNEKWEFKPSMVTVDGNPSQRMLETCLTVEEAIQYYQKYWEPGFSYGRIMVADKSGASVIISAKDNELKFDRSNSSRGFGFAGETLNKLLSDTLKPDFTIGTPIIQACKQEGQYATQYSSVYDLVTGDIMLLTGNRREIRINLFDELKKGAHYFDIPVMEDQLKKEPMGLQRNMMRSTLDKYRTLFLALGLVFLGLVLFFVRKRIVKRKYKVGRDKLQ